MKPLNSFHKTSNISQEGLFTPNESDYFELKFLRLSHPLGSMGHKFIQLVILTWA